MADPTFETRLRARIHEVLDSEEGPHPVWADAPATRMTSPRQRRGRWPLRLLGIAALLAIGGGVLSVAGSWMPAPDWTQPTVPGAPVIPAVLRGQFVAQLGGPMYPFYFVDLEDSVLVHGPGTSEDPAKLRAEKDTSATWAGRIVAFTASGPGSASIVIQAPPPCGEGRYVVQYNEVERRADSHPWTLTFTPLQDGCADRVALLVGGSDGPSLAATAAPAGTVAPIAVSASRVWSHQPIELVTGERYSSGSFGEAFHFLMPAAVAGSPSSYAWTWLGPRSMRLNSPWWSGTFYDDFALPTCDRALADVPSTPEAFEAWLRATGRSIEAAIPLEVDGRTAMRYDTSDPAADCPGQRAAAYLGRWYLIPTGHDTILFNVYGDTQDEVRLADDIVRSMTFD